MTPRCTWLILCHTQEACESVPQVWLASVLVPILCLGNLDITSFTHKISLPILASYHSLLSCLFVFSREAQPKHFPDHTKQCAEFSLLCSSCATRQDSAVPAVQPASSPSYLQQAGPSCPFPVMELSCSLERCDEWPVVCVVIYWLNIYILQCCYMLSPFLTFCLLVSYLIFMVIYRDLECNNLKSVWGKEWIFCLLGGKYTFTCFFEDLSQKLIIS